MSRSPAHHANPPAQPSPWLGRASVFFVALVFALLAWRQLAFIDRHAVNILYWDQWDFYAPLLNGGGLWDMFRFQHGPHRQGLGGVLATFIAHASDWNSRRDAFAVGLTLIAAAGLGLMLARRCGARGFALAAVPLLFLNLRQYEMFVGASNHAHGSVPMLLFMAILLSWFIETHALRLTAIALLTALCIHTGFGLFVGLVVPALLAVELFRHGCHHAKPVAIQTALALAVIAAAWALFATGYRFDPAVGGYHFPYEKPWEYLYFVAAMLNNFQGLRADTLPLLAWGVACTGWIVFLLLFHGWRVARHGTFADRRSTVITALAAFTLLYCLNTAVGRVFLGWQDAAAASRYVTLLIPAALATFLHLATLKRPPAAQALCLAFAAWLAYHTVELHTRDWRSIRQYSEGKRTWKAAYLETHNEETAAALARFSIYPAPVLGDRLRYLEANRLNLFNPDAKP